MWESQLASTCITCAHVHVVMLHFYEHKNVHVYNLYKNFASNSGLKTMRKRRKIRNSLEYKNFHDFIYLISYMYMYHCYYKSYNVFSPYEQVKFLHTKWCKMNINTAMNDKWEEERVLGSGGFGQVVLWRNRVSCTNQSNVEYN